MKTYKYDIILEKTESFLPGLCLGKNTLSEHGDARGARDAPSLSENSRADQTRRVTLRRVR